MVSTILVTGGLGFIGSHTVVELVNEGFKVIIVDNLSNSSIETYKQFSKLCNHEHIQLFVTSILSDSDMTIIFESNSIDMIIHFAAYKAVSESIVNPLEYYKNNVYGTCKMLEYCKKFNIKRFIFSSSATVYGTSISPLYEDSIVGKGITNPYGQSKYMCEQIIIDFSKVNDTKCVILRYFNPVGAHKTGIIGENPNGVPNNLMPFLLRVARKNNIDSQMDNSYQTLRILGNDYNTSDGTCIRDFIHVVDLANAHLCACKYNIEPCKKYDIFNIGTGKGTSVYEMVNTFTQYTNIILPYIFADRRQGDLEEVYCNNEKAESILGWKSKHTLKDIMIDSWNYIIYDYNNKQQTKNNSQK